MEDSFGDVAVNAIHGSIHHTRQFFAKPIQLWLGCTLHCFCVKNKISFFTVYYHVLRIKTIF